jgi:hypothetical protein
MGSQLKDSPTFMANSDATTNPIAGPQRKGFLNPILELSLGIKKTIGMLAQIVIEAINPARLALAPFNINNVGAHPVQV